MQRRRLAAALLLVAAVAGCASVSPMPATVVDATAANPQLGTLNRLIAEAGLADTLKAAGPYTVFAPSDEAFQALPPKTLAELSRDPALLRSVLGYHVLPGAVSAAQVANGSAKTLNGANLALARAGSFVTVDEAMVTQADLRAGNGVVHVVDRVLMPPRR